MDTVRSSQAETPEIQCIHEVRLQIPSERVDEVVRFYGELMDLAPWPSDLQIPGGLGLGDPQCGLYLQYRHDPRVEPMRRRFTLVVPSLDELEKRLSEQPWPFARYRGLGLTDEWIFVTDPIGHLIELRQLRSLM